ncbi:PspC domain-containing protein [Paenibacillus sp. JSM ZJ436]|uniref:PspC domain-containing protein n=1 Tax=Paenibacillus sp. JSM ZJ436 TaxID=3376190 RepID=UPI0037B36F04
MTKLYRSSRDKVFTGLIGGLSDKLGFDSTVLRIIFVVSIFITCGTTLWIYLIAALVVPKELNPRDPYRRGGRRSEYQDDFDERGRRYGRGRDRRYDQDDYDRYDPPFQDPGFTTTKQSPGTPPPDAELDAMLKDIEKKALKKEIEELKQKLSKYEKGDL